MGTGMYNTFQQHPAYFSFGWSSLQVLAQDQHCLTLVIKWVPVCLSTPSNNTWPTSRLVSHPLSDKGAFAVARPVEEVQGEKDLTRCRPATRLR
jgi:hypothetical protein